jgi:enterobactin synthetase component D
MQAVCCTPVQPLALPGLPGGLSLQHCRFDPAQLAPADFRQAGLTLPERLRSAAAKRQSEYLAGRLCAAAAITGLGLPAAYPERGEDGAPQWPAGVIGSISHSQGHALAVAGQDAQWRALGLDAEALIAPARARRLAGEILVAAEQAQFEALWATSPEAAARYLTLAFSAKESLFKALYPLVGRRFHFPAACVALAAPGAPFVIELQQALAPGWLAGQRLAGHCHSFDGGLLTLIAIAA